MAKKKGETVLNRKAAVILMASMLELDHRLGQGFSSSDDMTAKKGFFRTAFVYLKVNFDTFHMYFSYVLSDFMQNNYVLFLKQILCYFSHCNF